MQLVPWDLHGRKEDVHHVLKLIRQGRRLITLIGMGGVGKSVVARQVLREVSGPSDMDKYWFDLGTDAAGDDAFSRLSLRVREIVEDSRREGQDDLPLVVIDTSPSDLPVAELVRSLLEEHSDLQILATSRGRLRISLERPVEVKPFALPNEALPADANQLSDFIRNHAALDFFVERATAVAPDLDLDRNTVAGMLAVCRRLGGLPLALQMAALKANILGPYALLTELDRSMAALEDREPSAPARHRSMRACLAPSIDQLSPSDRTVLAAVAEFEGGCSLDTLRSLDLGLDSSGDRVQVLSVVSILVERQLLHSSIGHPDGTRMVVPTLVRDYLTEHQEGSLGKDKRHQLVQVLLEKCAIMAAIRGPEADHARSWFDEEYANLTQILGWLIDASKVAAAAELVQSLYLYWLHRGLIEEGLITVERILALGELDTRSEAQLRLTLGGLRAHVSSYSSAHGELGKAVELWRLTDSAPDLANALVAFSTAALELHGFDAAQESLEEAMALFHHLGDGWAHARALALLGAAAANDPEKADYARACLEEASATLLTLGDQVAASLPMEQLGRLLLDDGDYDQARLILEHGLKETGGVGDQVQTSAFLNLLALTDTQSGRPVSAATRYFESLEIAVRLGLRPRAVWCLEGLAESLATLGEHSIASAASASASIIRDDLGLEYWVEFCCPRRPSAPHPRPASRAARLASVGGSAWPPQFVLSHLPTLLKNLDETGSSVSSASTSKSIPDGLTRREAEILGLVAGGFTNRDIAEQLVISIDTVGRHITNLYRKIGARSRVDASAYAWRMNLLPPN